jgi:hypothetical protein
MEYVKPRFDTALLAYLQYAIQEEINRVSLAGGDVNKVPSVWLQGMYIYLFFNYLFVDFNKSTFFVFM